MASHGKSLPTYITKEFDEYLKCGRLENGFLRVRCASCHDEKLVAFSCKRRGFCPSSAFCLSVNQPSWVNCWVKAPTSNELTQPTHTIAHRVASYLERQGLRETRLLHPQISNSAAQLPSGSGMVARPFLSWPGPPLGCLFCLYSAQ